MPFAMNPDPYMAQLPKKVSAPSSSWVDPQVYVDPNDPQVRAQLAASIKAQQDANDAAARAATRANAQGNISSDPLYQQYAGNLSAQGIADAAARRAANQRAFINFGEDTGLEDGISSMGLDPNSPMYQMLFGDIDPNARQQAQNLTANGLSVTAGLSREHARGLQDLLDTLAARGSVRSGATGVGTGLEDQRALGAQFTARNNLLDYLSGVQANFASGEAARQGQLGTEAGNAAQRQLALHADDLPVPPQDASSFGYTGSSDPQAGLVSTNPAGVTQSSYTPGNDLLKRLNLKTNSLDVRDGF